MVKKIFLILVLIILLISTINIVQASSIFQGADNFISTGEGKNPIDNLDNLDNASEKIYNILLILGTVIAVIVGSILGIQFITGSVEQKGKVKESLIPFVIGCVVIFGAFGIWRLVIIMLR